MKKFFILIFASFLWAQIAGAQSKLLDKQDPEDKKAPLRVTSDRMVSDNKNNKMSFFGTVVAIKGKLKIESDEMYVWTDEEQNDVREMEAIGSVRITRAGKVATGQKAHYYAKKQQIILTGSPVLTEGKNSATGEKVVYYFEREDMEIYGGRERRSTLVIYPKNKPETKQPKVTIKPEKTDEPVKQDETKKLKKPAITKKPEKQAKFDKPGKQTEKVPIQKAKKIAPGTKSLIAIQVASYKNVEDAVSLKRRLVKKGYSAYIRLFDENQDKWYRVRVGSFKTAKSAKRTAKKLEQEEDLPSFLISFYPDNE